MTATPWAQPVSILDPLDLETPIDGTTSLLIVTLTESLARYGVPSYLVEEDVTACAERLGVAATVSTTPTMAWVSLGSGAAERTHLLRLPPAETDLRRLVLVDEVIGNVTNGHLPAAPALAQLRAITAGPPRYGTLLSFAAPTLLSLAAARFFGGAAVDLAAAGLGGAIIALFLRAAARSPHTTRVAEFLAGVIAALLGLCVHRAVASADPETITLSTLIALVPGLAFTTGVRELTAGSIVSGTARLTSALAVLCSLGFGVALGLAVGQRVGLGSTTVLPAVPLPEWTLWALVVGGAGAMTVLLQARRRDLPVITISGTLAFAAAHAATAVAGPELGAAAGAFTVGLGANLWARWADRPTIVALLPGTFFLVPGSVGFRSLRYFLGDDPLLGVETAFTMVMVAVGIVIGLMLSNVVVPPRGLPRRA